MSLYGAMSSALSSLAVNASRVGATADNIANVNTVGYKSTEVRSSSIVTSGGTGGGVLGFSRQSVAIQGLLQGSYSETHMAVSGAGFFVVESGSGNGDAGSRLYSRAGDFEPDNQGFLVNRAGYRLLARPVDGQGRLLGDGLEPVNLLRVGGTARATSRVGLGANLPADAALGDREQAVIQVRDSLGNALALTLVFEKSGSNSHRLSIGDPVIVGSGQVAGTARMGGAGGGAYSLDVIFDGGGGLVGFDTDFDGIVDADSPPNLFVGGPVTGAEDLDIVFDFGSIGNNDGLTRYGGDFTLGFINQNGTSYGEVAGVSVSLEGLVTARYENGETRPIYQVPLATFVNPNGLSYLTGNAYGETDLSGAPLFRRPGEGGAGTLHSGALEQSTVDLGVEFTRTIMAQSAYSFSLTVLHTVDRMQGDLLNISA